MFRSHTYLFYVTLIFITDINECFTDNGGCEQVCVNTEGSHRCACFQGYSYNEENEDCVG